MSNNEMMEFFKKQKKLEHHIIKSVTESLKSIRNPVVKQVLQAIALDSQKHAGIYEAAIAISTVTPALTDEEYRKLEEITKKHIEDEEKAISELNNILPKIKNEKIKFLIEAIAADEKNHHQLLNKVINLIVKKEAITEEDLWEILWKNVPFHGAPGG